MNSPIQAKPVGRGLSRLTDGATQSGCNVFECAGAVIGCAAACVPNPLSPACITCLGPLWGSCKDCF
jgi:hypothetical protein